MDLICEELEEKLGQLIERDAVGAVEAGVEPVGQMQKLPERRSVVPDERRGLNELSAVGDEIPIAGKAAHTLHGGEVDVARLEDLVRRRRRPDHLEFLVVANDRCAAETLENTDLDFLGIEGD